VNNEYLFKETSSEDFEYFCPFTIKAMVSPVRLVKYISEMTDSTSAAHIVFNSDANSYPENATIIPKTIHVYRPINNGNGSVSKSI
jgi:hypothetical protein